MMLIERNDAFHEAQFETQMRKAWVRLKLDDGAPAGDLLAAAVILDRRQAGVPASQLTALTRDTLIDTYADLEWLLFHAKDGGKMTLPFGTGATSERQGGIKIGDRNYVLDAGRPGLHEIEGVRSGAYGPNLARLQEMIRRKTARLACRRLGVPEAAAIFDNQPRQLLQFAPNAAAGGVVLQRQAYESGADRFCAATPTQLRAFADSIVSDMRLLWKHRQIVAARVGTIRQACEAALQDIEPAHGIGLRAIAVDMSLEDGERPPCLYVEFSGLDEALRPGVILDFAPGLSENWTPRTTFGQQFRREDVAELKRLGADGWIEPVAASVAQMAPGGAAAVLGRLATSQEAYVAIPTQRGTMHATLFWGDGTVKVEIDLPGVFSFFHDSVELAPSGLPDCIVAALPGHPLSALLPAPFANAGLITDASELNNGGLRLRIDKPPYRALRVDLASGRVW